MDTLIAIVSDDGMKAVVTATFLRRAGFITHTQQVVKIKTQFLRAKAHNPDYIVIIEGDKISVRDEFDNSRHDVTNDNIVETILKLEYE